MSVSAPWGRVPRPRRGTPWCHPRYRAYIKVSASERHDAHRRFQELLLETTESERASAAADADAILVRTQRSSQPMPWRRPLARYVDQRRSRILVPASMRPKQPADRVAREFVAFRSCRPPACAPWRPAPRIRRRTRPRRVVSRSVASRNSSTGEVGDASFTNRPASAPRRHRRSTRRSRASTTSADGRIRISALVAQDVAGHAKCGCRIAGLGGPACEITASVKREATAAVLCAIQIAYDFAAERQRLCQVAEVAVQRAMMSRAASVV